ncbi:hypothetical protein [Enterococcus sp. AZ196]|uniref:hypothetical protein n=1 Tax=Enterococcus sp. AZ196 TaxID=2774659 RepID=UPI003D2E7951
MTEISDLTARLPKDSTIAVIKRSNEKLLAFLSIETTDTRYSFTDRIDNMKTISALEAEKIIEDLNGTCTIEGIRTFNEDTHIWSITPLSEIKFVPAVIEFEE